MWMKFSTLIVLIMLGKAGKAGKLHHHGKAHNLIHRLPLPTSTPDCSKIAQLNVTIEPFAGVLHENFGRWLKRFNIQVTPLLLQYVNDIKEQAKLI